MHKLSYADSRLTAEYGIQVGRWSQYPVTASFPFGAMWCVIPPASHSELDRHPEVELAVVVGGSATFAVDGKELDAPTGTAVVLQPGERHVIHNRAADEPLCVLSIYWIPRDDEEPLDAR